MVSIIFGILFFSQMSLAQTQEKFIGTAKREGKVVYTEEHTAFFNSTGQVEKAQTLYKNPDGQVIAVLDSDFRKSLTAPAHHFEDKRFHMIYGVRYEGQKIVLFSQDGSEKEKQKEIEAPKDRLVVGCQGLGYYLPQHLEEVKKADETPLLFLIPGRLEAYSFTLKPRGKQNSLEVFDIEIQSWVLRIFAPRLTVYFDPSTGHLIRYKGLSNILSDQKKEQDVDIEYKWQGLSANQVSN